ncbi:DNA replication/repair protein RecF [Pseudoluteimonas lycopersici]|uniref:DNA replication and repair protein RecF n=1 Tax=Pseudoluteimonas lycopersici TaxID=1324796 RepID=A0A516V6E6_9GAMM|nr:DNA replication/repair protein RecF [Lysobacter lycopersici]QDQ74061.1 DNA replication/repair protein RecF [Lysobacter lycopersici]
MHLTRLRVRDLRCVIDAEIEPHARLNVITGLNGAGKSSLLEAIHLIAYGRSFRGRVRDGLIGSGSSAVEVFVEWAERNRLRRAGLRHTGARWEARLDGEPVDLLGTLSAAVAVLTFEPGSHALIDGSSEVRRRYLDWGLFHVEPSFLSHWRRYARGLKQRNALLKQGAANQLPAWEMEMAEAGERITEARRRYVGELSLGLSAMASALSPDLGPLALEFASGWKEQDLALADALLLARDRDFAAGFTTVGPHRANWRLHSSLWPAGEAPSRGQAKLCALACLLAQGEHFRKTRGEAPIFLLDDFAAELDRRHQQRLLEVLRGEVWQVFMTGTESPQGLEDADFAGFHVERGHVRTA